MSFITPVDGSANEFAVGLGRRIGVITWDGKATTTKVTRIVAEVETEPRYRTNRFNDAKCDRFGRLYAGTMRLEECGDIFEAAEGSLYKYSNATNRFDHLFGEVGVSNGLAWNETTNKFYYIDSCQLDVKEFDYDPKTGALSNRRQVISFRAADGARPDFVPDGMTIDGEGNLYVCTWGGSRIIKVAPATGEILSEIKFPVPFITSAAFGGPNLDVLYVTTAGDNRGTRLPAPAGALFKVTGLNVTGSQMYRAKV